MKNCIDILSEVFHRFPNKTALVFGDQSLTFAELQRRIEQVASALNEQGVMAGQIVPILLPRGVDPLVALFGIWHAGAAACILDANYPPDRIQNMREDCGTDLLIDSNWLQTAYRNDSNQNKLPPISPKPDDLAFIVFTSGSTGKPKGVMLPHHVITSVIENTLEFFQEDDIFLCTNPFSFVAILATAVAPLAGGITLHIADNIVRKDVAALADYVKANHISASLISPAMAPAFLKIADGRLRLLLTGSERVRDIYSEQTKCYCVYGASETGSLVSRFLIDRIYSNTPIGYADNGSRFYVLDENDSPVQQGEKGEICISGQIALGYLNRPELTAARFVPNPFSEGEDDKILFRTGDIGRILPNGAMEYVERKDWMIKVRGFRIEPGEIETVMLDSGLLLKAAVVGFTDRSGEQKLYGCYTADKLVSASLLREKIATKLPDYMLPAFLEQVESLPINANGKIDRSRIAPPDIAKYQAEYVAPTTEKERLLCDAFAQVLGLPQVGVNDDFVRLGGDSASAVEVQLLLPETMPVSAAALTGLRTPKAIAEKGIVDSIPIATDRKEWTVSYDEEWFLKKQAGNPNAAGHLINIAFTLSGNLDVEKLERSIQQLLVKHRVLRSAYHQDLKGHFKRTLANVPEVVLQRIRCPEDKIVDELKERNTPFELASGQLYRFFLFEIANDRHVLCCSAFHSILDGPGMQILWDELADLYSDRTDEQPRRPDFLDFAEWRETSPKYMADQAFYDHMFPDGLKINKMPMKVSPTEEPAPCDGAARHHFELSDLESGVKRYGISLFSLLAGALGLTLGKYCQSCDIVLCLVMNIRFANAELKKVLGMLADRFPIRLKWDDEQTLEDFLKTTDGLMTEILDHQGCSGRRWMKEAACEIDLDLTPIMNLNYRREVAMPSFLGLQIEPFPLPHFGDLPKILSMLGIMHQTKTGLDTAFLYPTRYFETDTAEGMNRCFARILQAITTGTNVSLSALLQDEN